MQEELAEVLGEATRALTRLDVEALNELEQRALRLQSFLCGVGRVESVLECSSEIEARFRVFTDVLRATGENLRVIESVAAGRQRAAGQGIGLRAEERRLWGR